MPPILETVAAAPGNMSIMLEMQAAAWTVRDKNRF